MFHFYFVFSIFQCFWACSSSWNGRLFQQIENIALERNCFALCCSRPAVCLIQVIRKRLVLAKLTCNWLQLANMIIAFWNERSPNSFWIFDGCWQNVNLKIHEHLSSEICPRYKKNSQVMSFQMAVWRFCFHCNTNKNGNAGQPTKVQNEIVVVSQSSAAQLIWNLLDWLKNPAERKYATNTHYVCYNKSNTFISIAHYTAFINI